MTHPPDDRDELDDDALPPHLRRLLDEGSDGPPLSRAAQERVLGRVLATVGVAAVGAAGVASAATSSSATSTAAASAATTTGATATTATAAVAATTTTAAATTATAAGGLALSVKAAVLAAGLGVAGLAGVGVVAVVDRAPTLPARDPVPAWSPPPAAASTSTSTPTAAPVAPDAEPASTPAPAPSTASTSSPASPSSPSSAPVKKAAVASPALESSWELPQLESARAALSAGRAAEALALVEDHARRAPGSALREEGRALAVWSLVALGRHDEARAAATTFATLHPQSLFLPRVQRAVASLSPSSPPSSAAPAPTP